MIGLDLQTLKINEVIDPNRLGEQTIDLGVLKGQVLVQLINLS